MLAEIVLNTQEDQIEIINKIQTITQQAMEGLIPFDQALKQRLALLSITRSHLNTLIQILKTKVTDSFKTHQTFLQKNSNHIYIISGGFKEFITPVVSEFGIRLDHVFANEFLFNERDEVIGLDEQNFLAQTKGKVKLVESFHLSDEVIVIGDGYTDYEIREAGLASAFYLFTENIRREHLMNLADKVLTNLNELVENNL